MLWNIPARIKMRSYLHQFARHIICLRFYTFLSNRHEYLRGKIQERNGTKLSH